jgi:hypothetical protein
MADVVEIRDARGRYGLWPWPLKRDRRSYTLVKKGVVCSSRVRVKLRVCVLVSLVYLECGIGGFDVDAGASRELRRSTPHVFFRQSRDLPYSHIHVAERI